MHLNSVDTQLALPILFSVIEIFALIALGAFARKLAYTDEHDIGRWSALVIDFFFPCLVFSSIAQDLDPNSLAVLWHLPLIGFGLILGGALLSFPLVTVFLQKHPVNIKKTFRHLCAMNNFGFLPIVLVSNVWGEQLLPKLFLLNLGSHVGLWTIGVGLLGGTKPKQIAKNILNPTIISLLSAIAMVLLGLTWLIPSPLMGAAESLGKAAVPSVLVLIGASLPGVRFLGNKRAVALITAIRLVLLPGISIWILSLLPIGNEAYRIAAVVAVMPAAATSTIQTRRFGGSPEYAAQSLVVSTIVSLITIPSWLVIAFTLYSG